MTVASRNHRTIIYSNMEDIHHPDAVWIKIYYVRDGFAHCLHVKAPNMTDESFDIPENELSKHTVVEAFSEERENEIRDFIFYECFENGMDYDDTAKAALAKYPAYELRAWLEGYMNPICLEQCDNIEQWVEKCMWKRHDLYWENHPMNQDYEDHE